MKATRGGSWVWAQGGVLWGLCVLCGLSGLSGLSVMGACGGMVEVALPVVDEVDEPEAVLVWVGRGEAERLEGGVWVRDPRFDYEFSVEQRRYAGRWRSFKTMRRQHPGYDGSAGPREQVLWFAIDYQAAAAGAGSGDALRGEVRSRLGTGEVVSDPGFRRATVVIRPEISSQAPFDTFRITQHYRYEEGLLDELVELVKRGDGEERPWVRNRERARLFVPGPFAARAP
ncbi:MAG TPA: hypothetical protein PK095_18120 [Myxococcota bacterium]|nr:hypothetical protein [Myxococcota bacterium]